MDRELLNETLVKVVLQVFHCVIIRGKRGVSKSSIYFFVLFIIVTIVKFILKGSPLGICKEFLVNYLPPKSSGQLCSLVLIYSKEYRHSCSFE